MRRSLSLLLATGLLAAACGRGVTPSASLPALPAVATLATPTSTPVPATGSTDDADPDEPAPSPAATPAARPSAGPAAPGTLQTKSSTPFDIDDFARSTFFEADTNHNGKVTKAELEKSAYLAPLVKDYHWTLKTLRGWDFPTFEAALTKALATNPEIADAQPPRNPERVPVLLVQGWGEPSYYFMSGIGAHLRKQGWQVYGINLFPNVTFAETQARKVEAKVKAILKETGASKINLVCHSFGGLISRQLIQNMGGDKYVDHYISIATPHHGTSWCNVAPGGACVDMHFKSDFLTKLNAQTIWQPVKYGCIWTKGDEIVLPAESAVLEGARVYPPVPFTEHLLILWSPTTYKYVDEFLAS